MGRDGFQWFIGVVEDRNDPSSLGRVRVRCLGYHSEDVVELPTADLPWAHVMHPVTDPCMHGLGNTPSFLVEGSYVVGFFRDPDRQQFTVMGSLPGIPQTPADPTIGFNDPRGYYGTQPGYGDGDPTYGPYPVDGDDYTMPSGHECFESDTSRLARGEVSETHQSLKNRRKYRITDIPIATQPNLSSVSTAPVQETRGTFDEPHPKGIEKDAQLYNSGKYPFNHVFESESGHIREIDDSPGAERLFTEHKSGTFEEIHPDGSKVVKVIGDNYEIIAGSSNVLIQGNVNLTTIGTVRELIKGNYHLEVEGDYTQKIHGSIKTKVGAGAAGGNVEEEIRGNHAYHITSNVEGTVGPLGGQSSPGEGNIDINVVGDEFHTIGGELLLSSINDASLISKDTITIIASNDVAMTSTSGITSIKAGTIMDLRAATSAVVEADTGNLSLRSLSSNVDIVGQINVDIDSVVGNIELNRLR